MLECQVAKRDPGVFAGSHLQSMSFLLGCGNFIENTCFVLITGI